MWTYQKKVVEGRGGAAGGDMPSTRAAATSSPFDAWTTLRKRMAQRDFAGADHADIAAAAGADDGRVGLPDPQGRNDQRGGRGRRSNGKGDGEGAQAAREDARKIE